MPETKDTNDQWGDFAYWSRNAAFEQCTEALMILDPANNQYIDCNIAACKLLGFAKQEILQLPISNIHGRELGQLIVFTEQVLSQGTGSSNRLSCRLKSGEHIPIVLSASRVAIKNKEYLIVAIKDVSTEKTYREKAEADRLIRGGLLEWKHLESIFQQGERDNLLMLTSVGDGIYCVDTNGLCTFINPAAQRLLGRTGNDVLGQNIHYVHHHTHEDGSHYPVEECPIYAAIRDGIVHEGCQEVFWKHDGMPFPVEFTSTPIISDSSIIGAVVVFRDISERLETENKLRAALEEVNLLKERLEDENAYLQQEFLLEQKYHGIIGNSHAIKRILQQIEMVAQTEASVLITGESGTGKELIARAIHEASPRKDKPLIRVNCAAIPHELFESEFFGHVKGAFTGALRDRIGRFELADGGTIFLDEVGEIPLDQQSKLLRVLQEGQLERVGDEKTRDVDVRIITATNRDLKKEAEQKKFREDLFFRLNVFPIHSPSLQERGEDIILLAKHFVDKLSPKFGKTNCTLKHGDIRRLQSYTWPGNIRELQNLMERAIITSSNNRLNIDLPTEPRKTDQIDSKKLEELANNETSIISDEDMQEKVKRNMLLALEQCDWKLFGKDGAAKLLSMKPTTLASRIKRLGLSK
jgi:hydrogenase-4 transcriptional activator